MSRRFGPPVPRYETGPKCGEHQRGDQTVPPCSFRHLCFGYAPATGPQSPRKNGSAEELPTRITTPYLFIGGFLGPEEVAQGANLVGKTGGVFNALLRENTPMRRGDMTEANAIRCRPVVWGSDGNPALVEWSGDHLTNSKPGPPPAQIRECSNRYLGDLLERFEGKKIIAMGKQAAQAMLGRPVMVTKARGNIYEHGVLKDCAFCDGEGVVPGKEIKCKTKGCKNGVMKCAECSKWKHLKKCESRSESTCTSCGGSGKETKPPKTCSECKGAKRVPKDPDNPYVCEKLKPGQLLYITYNPAVLLREGTLWEDVSRDFSRMVNLEKELEVAESTRYDRYPPPHATKSMLEANRVVVDLETPKVLDPSQGEISHFAFTDRPGYGCVISPSDSRCHDVLRRPEVVGQNFVLFDWWWLHRKGFHIPQETKVVDTRFLGKLINPDTPNDLVYLTGALANPPIRGFWKAKHHYRDDIEKVACVDVDATYRVLDGALEIIERRGQSHLVWDYLVPLGRTAFEVRCGGMKIDRDRMIKTKEIVDQEISEIRNSFPFKSEHQHKKVHEYLYQTLGLPERKKVGTWQITADRNARDDLLGILGRNDRLVKHMEDENIDQATTVLENLNSVWDLSKLSTSFLKYELSGQDRVHPELNPFGTATGRFSAKDPNVQQVPKCKCSPKCYGENPLCKSARYLFIPDEPDWRVFSMDLRQAEVIGLLWNAEAWDVLKKVLGGYDSYQAVADISLGREASKKERDEFKTNLLAFIFGEAPRTMALRLHKHIKEIYEIQETMMEAIPGLRWYRDKTIQQCMDRRFVESVFGFRRYIRVDEKKGRAANQAANAPIQNIPPTVINRAMMGIHRELPKPARVWTQVHDEVVVVGPKELTKEIVSCMMDHFRTPVPELAAQPLKMFEGLVFNVDLEIGTNWGTCKEVDVMEVLK